MLSLEKCKELLNEGKLKFNNEEIKSIREYLYLLAELELENSKELK